MDTAFPFLPPGWAVDFRDGQYRAVWPRESPGRFQSGNRRLIRAGGQPPGSAIHAVLLTLGGGGGWPPLPEQTSRPGSFPYQFQVMPFGLCNAPTTFERLMDHVLCGMHWSRCLVYLDDVISFGTTAPLLRLEEVLVQKYVDNYYSMRSSNDNDRADPVGLSSLGVVDLDTSIVPDVFGLRAFDSCEPISRMLPGQFPVC